MFRKEAHNLYLSPNIMRIIKSRWTRFTGSASYTKGRRLHLGFWLGSQKESDRWEDLDVVCALI
jgi:hypothetical protein